MHDANTCYMAIDILSIGPLKWTVDQLCYLLEQVYDESESIKRIENDEGILLR